MSTPSRRNERLLRDLAAAQTPRQQEIAKGIYDRLKAGESVDDVKDLIDKMARVITEEHEAARGDASGGVTEG